MEEALKLASRSTEYAEDLSLYLPLLLPSTEAGWGASCELVFTLQCCCLNHSVYCNTSCLCDACPLSPHILSPTAQFLALLFEHPMCVCWCFLSNQQTGKSLFIREERAAVYYLNITFLLAGIWTTAAKPGCSHPKICKLAWNEYFSVMSTDELNDEKFYFTSSSCDWISWRLQF